MKIRFSSVARALFAAGAGAAGAVRAGLVGDNDREEFRKWIEEGANAGMYYMANHGDLRFNPSEMHEGTEWIISCAFPYPVSETAYIASYALGDDYHKVIPKRIKAALRELGNDFCEASRICVDSAPVRERYWAVKSGIAARCDSGLVTVPGYGTRIFLTEILVPAELTDDSELPLSSPTAFFMTPDGRIADNPGWERCDHCGLCRRSCPGQAIDSEGKVNARKCVSYLTIEHRGPWSAEQLEIMMRKPASETVFGCEICQRVCHLNRKTAECRIGEFSPRPELAALTKSTISRMSAEDFSRLFRNNPVRRTGLEGLKRNAGIPD